MSAGRIPTRTQSADSPAGRRLWRRAFCHPGFICLWLALVTLAVYGPVAKNDYVDYDDGDYVTANPHVQSGLKWSTVVWAFTTGHASNWHPLTWLSHALDCQLFGQHPGPQHLVSLALHIANSLLLFLLLRRMTGALWRSALAAAFFALHPLHVESVAWISERKDVLSALFFLLTLGAYVRYVEMRRAGPDLPGRRGRPWPACSWYGLALFFFTLGLMSKPMLVTLPFVLLLLDYWPLARLWPRPAAAPEPVAPPTAKGRGSKPAHRNPAAQLRCPEPDAAAPARSAPGAETARLQGSAMALVLLEKLPFFALCVGSSMVTFLVQRAGGAVSTVLGPGARLANALVSYARYLGKTLWPMKLSVLYPHPGHWPVWQVIGVGILLGAISATLLLLVRRRPCLAVGWLWFLGMLVPVIGVVQVGIQSMADRYMYLPLAGLLLVLLWGIPDCLPRWPGRGTALLLAAGLALALCAGLTAKQVQFWRDSEALFTRTVEVTEKNYLAYNNLGFYRSRHGRLAEAMEDYRRSLELNPNYEEALNNMGYALAGLKRPAEALGFYAAALRLRPNHPDFHNNLGNALSDLGKIDEAIQHYRIALEQKPDHADAHGNLGIALAMQGKLDAAMPHFHQAIRLNPADASAHSNLGNALAVQHRFEEALTEYQQALRLKPDEAQAHNNLGNALAGLGRLDEAIAHYHVALRLKADNPEALGNLAGALATQGNLPQAIEHYQAALRLMPNSPDFHYGLADALARQGRRDEALTHLAQALRLRPDFPAAKQQWDALGGPR